MDQVGFEEPSEEELKSLENFDKVFVERSEELRTAFDKGLENIEYKDHTDIVNSVYVALTDSGERDEEFYSAVRSLFYYIMLNDSDSLKNLKENYDISTPFFEFLLNMTLEYGVRLQRLVFRTTQGDNWWSNIETDTIFEDDGQVRHTHRITVDKRSKFEIDSVPYADWPLISHLLYEVFESYRISDGESIEMIDLDSFERIRTIIYHLEEDLGDENIELREKEQILSDTDEEEENNE